MNRFFSALFLAAGLLASGMPSPADASTPPQQHALAEGKNSPVSPQQRKQAVENLEKLLGKRLFKKAAEQALKQLHEYDDQYSGADLLLYYQALTRLNALDDSINLDSILQEQMKRHGANPHFLRDAALLYQSACHTFKLVDGAYIRGAGPWDGEYSGEARDRVEALRCLVKAMQLAEKGNNMKLLGQLRFITAQALPVKGNRYAPLSAFQSYAALGNLTNLKELPDYVSREEASPFRNVATVPVMVNAGTGKPEVIFYHASSSWETAKNDGERMRWLLDAAIQANPELANQVNYFTASWCRRLFSYANTAPDQEFVYGPGNAGMVAGINPAELKTDQTIVKTDWTGNGKFLLTNLPPDYDFIRIASAVRITPKPDYYVNAANLAADEFLARNQRPAAAQFLGKILQTWNAQSWNKKDKEEFLDVADNLKKRIASITEPNGTFDMDKRTLLAGEPVTVSFSYRNASRARVAIRPVDMKRWQEERMDKVQTSKTLGKAYKDRYSNLGNLLFSLLHDSSYARYLGEEIKGDEITLTPGNRHLNHIAHIPVPTRKPGWYLLTVTLENGYRFHRFLTLSDMVLVRRSVPEGNLWFLADAGTGMPVEGGSLRLLRYRQDKTLQKRQVKGITDKDGAMTETIPHRHSSAPPYNMFLGIASKGDSYVLAGISDYGWESGNYLMDTANKASDSYSCFFLESQPVYRPGQTARFKGVLFRPDIANPGTKDCAGKKLTLTIASPTGDESIFPPKTVTTDSTGSFELELLIPADAPLGQYGAKLKLHDSADPDFRLYAPLFRMEEYKKPEFSVRMDAPAKPIRLGQPIPVAIQADYYAGGPVSGGKATITITRTLGANIWTPYWKWSWLYDRSFSPYYIPFFPDAPLTVLEKTVPLDKDGKASVELPTAQDARDFPSSNVTYRVSVSVTDASLREVSASGQVIATFRPFNIFTTLNRGYAPAGTPVQASITAATADGAKIAHARGTCVLQHIRADGRRETLETWDIATGKDGEASLSFQTGESGLYSLSTTLEDGHGNKVEESFQFLSYGKGKQNPFKINPLSIHPDKKEYAPGDTARLLVTSDYPDARVWTFLRNSWKNESRRLVSLDRQTALVECRLTREDMPNMGVNAFTVRNGELHEASADLLIPPAGQLLAPSVVPGKSQYRPGEQGNVTIQVKGPDGKPVSNGIVALAVYDKALEYIARPNITDISKTVWGRLNETGFLSLKKMTASGTQQDRGPGQPSFQSLLYRNYGPMAGKAKGTVNGFAEAVFDSGADAAASRALATGAAAPTAVPVMAMAADKESAESESFADGQGNADAQENGSPHIQLRTNFADCIKWCGTLKTDEEGNVAVPVEMPDNLTTWKASAWVITPGLQVGQASAEFLTTKDFMVSMQAPRFFVEKDIVMLSALVRNRTGKAVRARVSISRKDGCLELLPADDPAVKGLSADTDNSAVREVDVPAQGQAVVNWWAAAVREGTAAVAMEASAGSTGDAMQMNFPVLVHGMKQLHAESAAVLSGEQEKTLSISLPQQRRREESELVVKVSPSIALSMVEALPYLAEYPYGCVEQTLNRFLPALVVTDTLKQLGLNPGAALKSHRSLNPRDIRNKAFHDSVMKKLERNPVYDEAALKKMAARGISSLREKQLSNGSWGWFGGAEEGDPVMTAHVAHGLKIASNTVNVPKGMLSGAVRWLKNYQERQTALLEQGDKFRKLEQLPDGPEKKEALRKLGNYRLTASATDTLVYSVLAECGVKNLPMERYLFRDRLELPVISQIQLAEILLDAHRMDDFNKVMPVISQFLQQDDSLQTAWLRLPNAGYWWRWYGSSAATQAAYLKLMSKSAPGNPVTARLAKWLLDNRANGSYWDSTKDTADCLEALSAYLLQTREGMEDMEAEILYDGVPVKTVSCTKETLFTFDNAFRMSGKALADGSHVITIRRKKGSGNIYANSTLSYFSLEDPIPAAGNAVTVERSYYRIRKETVKNGSVKDTQTDAGELVSQGRDLTRRTLLKNGDVIASGDIIEVVMTVKTKNDVEYLMLLDPKPAGCESRETASGYARMGTVFGYREIGDEEIRLFLSSLPMGQYQISHRLRAERPGRFSALPAVIEAMYAPELRGNSREHKIGISMPVEQNNDQPQ
ncbi:alpha-2-macroglobulin family protein [Akkermansia muciniphila]|uniref:alpha-2-macroglobulin family protein n=1 Tax=Akkermansia muciniphila TaxID=239935 RepID=UPI001BFFBD97|nr:alpha-2-macroglobulin family protein [Akkermansia muciniphila]MBT8791756.1 hypothetical protein [Akkermansia muciniphila]